MPASPTAEAPPSPTIAHVGIGRLCSELFKARLTLLVLLTTLMGYFLGSPDGISLPHCLHALGGTSMLAAGAAALNQWIEREHDARMRRTASRPLPSGQMQPTAVLAIGVGVSVGGLLWLALWVNLLTAFLGALTLATYLFLYTPLKRITVLNTIVGAIPGALPPLMGWTAATGTLSPKGWALFAILFFWQIPHFMAIAWIYREEYAKAGFRMLSGVDPDGRRSAASAIRNTIALIAVSLVPRLQGVSGNTYLSAALLLGGLFLLHAVRFAILLDVNSARRLFFSSIIYLPVLLTILVIDRTKTGPSTASFLSPTPTFSVPLRSTVVLNFAAPPVPESGS